MRTHWIELLACPRCGADLQLSHPAPPVPDEIADGDLRCVRCEAEVPLRDEILHFLPEPELTTEEARLKRSEQQKRDEEAAAYNSMFDDFEEEVEREAVLELLRPAADDLVVDVGIGTGLIARAYVPRVRGVVGVDFSRESLRVARDVLRGGGGDFCLIHADACSLPLKPARFYKAISTQVFEHLPSAALRGEALSELARVLQPGGALALSAYYHSPERRLTHRFRPGHRTAKEGLHSDGAIYYYSFGARELRSFLGAHFRVTRVRGIMQRRPYLPRFGKAGLLYERLAQRSPIGLLTGKTVIARAVRPGG
ncbi:MAG: methyltransferase domain-containing protein [Armatimonadota bacterium]